MEFSIIVPTYQEEGCIERCLRSLAEQEYKQTEFEIIISDACSTDATVEKALQFTDRIIMDNRRGIAFGRNAGALSARGDIFVFVDADAALSPDFLIQCHNVFINPAVVGMTGIASPSDGKILQRCVYKGTYSLVRIVHLLGASLFPGICVAYRREAFMKLGGFREDLGIVEDLDLSRRISHIGLCTINAKARASVSTRRLEKHLFSTVAFHIYSDIKYLLTGKSAAYYPKVEEMNSWERFMAESMNNLLHCNPQRLTQFIIRLSVAFLVLCAHQAGAQSVYVPVQHEVYDFLKRMETRQLLLDYQDAALPLSRMQVAAYLTTLEQHVNAMNRVERETFEFLKTEFNYELLKIAGDPQPSETRWHIYSRDLTGGILNLDLDYSRSQTSAKDQSTRDRSQGLKMYGYMYNTVGFDFHFIDHLEKGDNIHYSRFNDNQLDHFPGLASADIEYYKRVKTPLRGVLLSVINGRNEVQYDEINAQLSVELGSFTLSLEKMNNVWGYGRNGSVIFSDHAPSYPQIKLRVPLSKDIDFVYFHGELNSNIADSSLSYTVSYPSQGYSKYREVDHSKYIAAHQLEISLWHGVDFSLGESVVYSDRGPLLIYLIPVMFFKAGEHYNGDKDNCQLFGSIDLNVIKNVNAYLSLFIDELNTDKLFDPNLSHRQVAFTSGLRIFDCPVTNFDMTLEYTRVNPATYNHSYPSTTFASNGFILGSWMGQNADDLFLELGLNPMHASRLSAFGDIYRKGGSLSLKDQYAENQGNWTFLFGPLHRERSVGIAVKYQPLRDVFINFKGQLHTIEDEADPAQNRSHQFEFTLGARIGIW